MEEGKCLCPILNKEIKAYDCFDAALVFEDISPISELPAFMEYTTENQSVCLKCKYHPK